MIHDELPIKLVGGDKKRSIPISTVRAAHASLVAGERALEECFETLVTTATTVRDQKDVLATCRRDLESYM